MQTFTKQERLCSKKKIDELFGKGKSFLIYPLSIRFTVEKQNEDLSKEYPAKVLFVVSKHNFKRAIKRNIIKRLLRECYRKNKQDFYSFLYQQNLSICFSVAYISKELPDYQALEAELKKALHQICKRLETSQINRNTPLENRNRK